VTLKTCTVVIHDLNETAHMLDVTAATLYEAVAQALATARGHDWVGDIGNGLTAVTVKVRNPEPDATNVAGLRTWNSLGRFVKRGEKGIFILAPMVGKRSTKDVATDEPSETATTEGQRTLYGFRAVYVFERLSRDLRPSLCAPDGSRLCHFGKTPR
jgi:hypothetical protein